MTAEESKRFVYDEQLIGAYLDYIEKEYAMKNPSLSTMQSYESYDLAQNWKFKWSDFLREPWEYKLEKFKNVMPQGNVIIDGLPVLGLKDLYVEVFGKAIELKECSIESISDTEPWVAQRHYRCLGCDKTVILTREEAEHNIKKKCDCSSSAGQSLIEETDFSKDALDSQWIKVQEIRHDPSQTDLPLVLPALLKGKEMMWLIRFNQRVQLIGLVKYRPVKNSRDNTRRFVKWFDVFGVRNIETAFDERLTNQDIDYIKQEMDQPQFYDKLLASFAPHLYGLEPMKEAALLALASIKLPRPARILFVTDPGMGKSEILKYAYEVAPAPDIISHLVQMGRATKTGLTVSSEIDADTGRRHIKPGVFAAAHEGLLCLDELQLSDEKELMNLNDVLESGLVRYALPGGNKGKLDANCALLMACNPHQGRIGDELALGELLKFMGRDLPQFLSRLNLVLIMKDNTTDEEERKIVKHMYRHSENDPNCFSRYEQNWTEEGIEEEEEGGGDVQEAQEKKVMTVEYYGKQTIRKILKYVVDNVQLESMPRDYEEKLIEHYMRNRSDVATSANKIITKRFLRHAIVLSQYMARLKGLTKPTDGDVKRATDLLEKTMSVAAFDPKRQEMDVNMFNGSRSQREIDRMDKQEQLKQGMEKACKDEDGKDRGYFTMEDIKYVLMMLPNSKWKSEVEIERVIQQLWIGGKLMEKEPGRYVQVD